MIKVTINDSDLSIRAEGHAGYDKKGKDIVCAAVSILFYAYAAELLKTGVKTEIKDEGDVFEIVPEGGSRSAYDTVLMGLKLLAEAGADPARVELLDVPTNDAWCRDHGPVCLVNRATGARLLNHFRYNSWGGKFPPWDLDAAVLMGLESAVAHVKRQGQGLAPATLEALEYLRNRG